MVTSRHPTRDELVRHFEDELTSAASGSGIHSETGLDLETEAALVTVARAYPAITTDLIMAARAAFAGQLDGSNAVELVARIRRLLDEEQGRA